MKKILLFASLSCVLYGATTTVYINSGYDMVPGNEVVASTNNAPIVSGLYGIYFPSNYYASVVWQIPPQIVRNANGGTNVLISYATLTTNGAGQGHTNTWYLQVDIWTNGDPAGKLYSNITTNTFTPDANTNINTRSFTNTLASTNITQNTNISYATLTVTHETNGLVGSDWLLNAKIMFR